jgi:hypothetical protein
MRQMKLPLTELLTQLVLEQVEGPVEGHETTEQMATPEYSHHVKAEERVEPALQPAGHITGTIANLPVQEVQVVKVILTIQSLMIYADSLVIKSVKCLIQIPVLELVEPVVVAVPTEVQMELVTVAEVTVPFPVAVAVGDDKTTLGARLAMVETAEMVVG